METSKPYFFQSFAILLLSAVFFLLVKEVLPSKLFSDKAGTTKNVLIDSMLIDAFNKQNDIEVLPGDTITNRPIVYDTVDDIRFPTERYDNYTGNQYLISFYEKLYQMETNGQGNIRIAYFGDSMTDGDMIVQDFRSFFQQRFGGLGVGFVAITSESASSRSSVVHEYSRNWKTQSYLNVKRPLRPFGINGHVFFANDTTKPAWTRYKAGKGAYTATLENPTLFYGRSDNREGAIAHISGKDTVYKALRPDKLLNTLRVASTSVKNLKTHFVNADSIPIYGFNFDDGKGVHVDNFSQRGNSGIPISQFNIPLMNAFQHQLDYDLIVLHYGTNVLNYGSKNFSWYDKSMTRTVNRLRECFPGVAILIVSTADKATKYDIQMKTDSAVVPLTHAQKRYAIRTRSGFVNLFTLMGGDGSITKWAGEEPAYANKDYTHFNFRGSKKIAALLFGQISEGYRQYKLLRSNRTATASAPAADTLIPTIETE